MKKYIYFLTIVLGFIFINGCASGISQKQIFSVDQVKIEAQKTEAEFIPYTAILIPMPKELFIAERYGLVHELYFQNDKSKNKPIGDKISGFLVFRDYEKSGRDEPYLLTIIPKDKEFDHNRKFFIGSRVKNGQLMQYGPENGKDTIACGGIAKQKFNWKLFKKPSKYSGIKIHKINNQTDELNQIIKKDFEGMNKLVRKIYIPTRFENIVKSFGVIDSNKVTAMLATDFHKAYLLFGVEIWSVIETLFGKENMQSIYYGTRTINGYQLGEAIADLQRQIDEINSDENINDKAMDEWRAHAQRVETEQKKMKYEKFCREYGKYCNELKKLLAENDK